MSVIAGNQKELIRKNVASESVFTYSTAKRCTTLVVIIIVSCYNINRNNLIKSLGGGVI